MYRQHKIKCVIPVGRQEYLEILLAYLERLVPVIDEIWFLWNVKNPKDQEFLLRKQKENSSLYKIKETGLGNSLAENPNWGQSTNVKNFYNQCVEDETIYIKIDDDIVFVECENFTKFLDYRLDNPDLFLAFPLIINTAVTSFKLQKMGILKNTDPPIGTYTPDMGYPEFYRGGIHTLDKTACQSGEFCEYLHRLFTEEYSKTKCDNWRFEDWILTAYENININFCAWFGKDFKPFVEWHANDENDLTWWKPILARKYCGINTDMIVSHYAFWTQRQYLDKKNILDLYRL